MANNSLNAGIIRGTRDRGMAWTALPESENSKGITRCPKLPPKSPIGGATWSKATRDWWAEIWSSPASSQWRRSDYVLIRLAALVELVHSGEGTAALQAQILALEDRYGMNPKAMLQLRWKIVPDVVEPGQVLQLRQRPQVLDS